jgi:hypothetical protein
MLFMVAVDRGEVWNMLSRFRNGELTSDELATWAGQMHRREATMRLAPDGGAVLALVLTELADPARPPMVRRAEELAFKLDA